MGNLCSGMKVAGHLLEMNYREKMDMMQTVMTKICQDRQVDLSIRLQVLEIVELRTLDWTSNIIVERYYSDRFEQLEDIKKRDSKRKTGEKRRKLSFPSLNSINESGGNSDDLELNNSKADQNFNITPNAIKYTKAEILNLSTSRLAKIAPPNWKNLLKDLPPAIVPKSGCVVNKTSVPFSCRPKIIEPKKSTGTV